MSKRNNANRITQLLHQWQRGDQSAQSLLIENVLRELRKISNSCLRRDPGHTLQPTELINEAYIRMTQQKAVKWEDRAHFYGIASHLMREITIERLRKRNARKRGGGVQVESFDECHSPLNQRSLDLVKLDEALLALEKFDADKCRLVEMRYFGGLTIEETAEVRGSSPATVKREWKLAKAWLFRRMQGCCP